jgi:hypothetical protein
MLVLVMGSEATLLLLLLPKHTGAAPLASARRAALVAAITTAAAPATVRAANMSNAMLAGPPGPAVASATAPSVAHMMCGMPAARVGPSAGCCCPSAASCPPAAAAGAVLLAWLLSLTGLLLACRPACCPSRAAVAVAPDTDTP